MQQEYYSVISYLHMHLVLHMHLAASCAERFLCDRNIIESFRKT